MGHQMVIYGSQWGKVLVQLSDGTICGSFTLTVAKLVRHNKELE